MDGGELPLPTYLLRRAVVVTLSTVRERRGVVLLGALPKLLSVGREQHVARRRPTSWPRLVSRVRRDVFCRATNASLAMSSMTWGHGTHLRLDRQYAALGDCATRRCGGHAI